MAAGDVTPGRRVESPDALELPGDYALAADRSGVWFVLPTAVTADPFAEPYNQHNGRCRISDKWTITEEDGGTVTVSPSIAVGMPVYWHGFLERGVWREV